MSLLERAIDAIDQRLLLIGPPSAIVPEGFDRISPDPALHVRLTHELQRFRGSVYLKDGAITSADLSRDGRHATQEDARSWHLVLLDGRRDVSACIWYREHENSITMDDLRLRECPLAIGSGREPLAAAIRTELARARTEGVKYSEVGGWAVSEQARCTPEGLLLILSTFALSRLLGGALGVATATARHSSAAILKRLGLSPLPFGESSSSTYFDPRYNCEMELLRYDTRQASRRYEPLIRGLTRCLGRVPVVTNGASSALGAAA